MNRKGPFHFLDICARCGLRTDYLHEPGSLLCRDCIAETASADVPAPAEAVITGPLVSRPDAPSTACILDEPARTCCGRCGIDRLNVGLDGICAACKI